MVTLARYCTATHTAALCNLLQHAGAHCRALQSTTEHYRTLQNTATCCHAASVPVVNALDDSGRPCQVLYCNTLQRTATESMLQHVAVCCNMLQCNTAAMILDMLRDSNDSVLQCVAVCCDGIVSCCCYVCRHSARQPQECVAVPCNFVQYVAVFCSELPLLCLQIRLAAAIGVWCSVLHRVAVCCDVLQ